VAQALLTLYIFLFTVINITKFKRSTTKIYMYKKHKSIIIKTVFILSIKSQNSVTKSKYLDFKIILR